MSEFQAGEELLLSFSIKKSIISVTATDNVCMQKPVLEFHTFRSPAH